MNLRLRLNENALRANWRLEPGLAPSDSVYAALATLVRPVTRLRKAEKTLRIWGGL